MRTRELLLALAAGSGAIFALLHILGADRPRAAPPATTTADRESHPGPAADAAPPTAASPADGRGGSALPTPTVGVDSADPETSTEIHPWYAPDRWFARDEEIPGLLRRLGDRSGEDVFLRGWHRVWGSHALGRGDAAEPGRTAGRDPKRTASAFDDALGAAADPVARQRLIFQMAITLPPETAFPRLRSLRRGEDPADAEDALCALAFRGDPEAGADFAALASLPSTAVVGRIADDPAEFDSIASDGDRTALRAWRCIEALDGASYFDRILEPVFSTRRHEGFRSYRIYPWSMGAAPAGTAALVLPSWLRRYPGHPGSDDMAFRLARRALDEGDREGALVWASLSATLPDQAMSRYAVDLLVSLAELSPGGGPPIPAEPWRNRNLFEYIRLRRIAAERSFAEATAEVRTLASAEPTLEVSRAFLARWAEPPSRGLDSGTEPLATDDPLRRVAGERIEARARGNPACTWGAGTYPFGADGVVLEGRARDEARVHPAVEAVRLPLRRLAFQFRCWESLGELERRAEDTPPGDARADILYKVGAVLYHERDSLYPVYAEWGSSDRSGLPDAWTVGGKGDEEWQSTLADSVRWLDRTLPHSRAARIFERVRDEFPGASVADRAAFSAGLAHIRASEDRPLRRWEDWKPDLNLPHAHRVAGMEAFEACARDYPSSPFAGDAAAAARWWRKFLYGGGSQR